MSRVIKRLQSHSAGERTVTDDSDYALSAAGKVARLRHSQSCADRGGPMAGIEGIMRAFVMPWESADTSQLPQGGELFTPSCEEFVRVTLMAHIPDDLIMRRLEDPVKRDSQLHHTQGSGKVAAGAGDHRD